MTLREARVQFTRLIAQLITRGFELGYELALGEGADFLTVKDPTSDHMKASLHSLGLAQDVALYLEGAYLTATSDYKDLGEFWQGLHPYCRWGGDWDGDHVHESGEDDGNHFSFAPPELVGNRA